MNIASSCDVNFLPGLLVTWGSILMSSPSLPIDFHLLHDGIPQGAIEKLTADLRKISNSFTINAIQIEVKQFDKYPAFHNSSMMTYARLLLADIIHNVRYLLYIDCDILVLRDVSEFEAIELGDHSIAAVMNEESVGKEDLKPYRKDFPETIDHKYFNAGLLWLNLEKIRSSGDFGKCMALLGSPQSDFAYHDQTVLNIVFAQRCLYLNKKCNYQMSSSKEFSINMIPEIAERKINFHFDQPSKPWMHQQYDLANRLFNAFRNTLDSSCDGKEITLSSFKILKSSLHSYLSAVKYSLLALTNKAERKRNQLYSIVILSRATCLTKEFLYNRNINIMLTNLLKC